MLWKMRLIRGYFGCIFGLWWGPRLVILDLWFRVPCDGQDRLMGRDGYRYELMPLQQDFNHKEPCQEKSGILAYLLGKIVILHRKWLIEKSKNISWWQNRFRGMWCSWKCKIHLYFPERLFYDFQIFFYIVLLVPWIWSILSIKGMKKFIKNALFEWVTGWSI